MEKYAMPVLAFAVAILIIFYAFGLGRWSGSHGPSVNQQYSGQKYTGKSCVRRDGSPGREGYGPSGQLGCWKF